MEGGLVHGFLDPVNESCILSLTTFLSAKPHFGIAVSFGGLCSAILAYMKVLTIVFGFAGAFVEFIAGCLTFAIERREWINGKK